jgi:hypothetical protein
MRAWEGLLNLARRLSVLVHERIAESCCSRASLQVERTSREEDKVDDRGSAIFLSRAPSTLSASKQLGRGRDEWLSW